MDLRFIRFRASFSATRYTQPPGRSMAPTRFHRERALVQASAAASAASDRSPVTMANVLTNRAYSAWYQSSKFKITVF